MNKSKALVEKRNSKIAELKAITDKAENEERALSEDEMKAFADMENQVKALANTIEAIKTAEGIDQEEAPNEEEAACGDSPEEKEKRELEAFENYIRSIETRADANLTKGDNGAVIPTTIANKIITKVYDICPVLKKSDKYNVKGNLDIPYYDDTTDITVTYADEFTDLESKTGKFQTVNLTGYLAGALTKVSKSLINNSNFDIVNFVVNHMAEAISRFIENELLNGTTGKVTGLSDVTTGITAASSTAITADELIDLKDSIKDAYQNAAMFVMNSATRTALRKLKDANGRYLLQDDINSAFGSTLLGKDVYVSDNMPGMAAGKAAIYYGDFGCLATKFSEEMEIQVLQERYAAQHAVGVVGWLEFDSKVENAQGLAKLTMKAA